MNVLGVILARAGSAGLPEKHLLPLLGRPVIAYTLDHARRCARLSRVVVTSDCGRIRKLAESNWFETIARPASLATAEASVQDTILHALETVEARSSFRAEAVAVMYGNVAVRADDVTDRAIAAMESSRCDSVRSFAPVGKWHPAWMHRFDDAPDDGARVSMLHANSTHRRQDLAPLYLHDGAALVVSRASMLRAKDKPEDPHAFFGVDRRGIRTEAGETVEIDVARDLYLAEAILRDRAIESRAEMRLAS